MNGSETSEHLVEAATKGDHTAVSTLLERLLPGLRGYLARHAGARILGKESSADLAQSVCREVLEDLQQGQFEYRGEQEFRQWLYQAAALKVQNRARYYGAQKRDVAREQQLDSRAGGGLQQFFESLRSPSQQAVQREELDALQQAFEQLPERYQEIILLCRVQGLGHQEVAARLNTSEANSRMLLSRALARLASLARRSS